MKRLLPIALILVFAMTLCGCININLPALPGNTSEPTNAPSVTDAPEAPTDAPTDAPTEAPTDEPTEAPTPEPVLGYKDHIIELKLEAENKLDIDLDGLEDTLYVSTAPGPDYEELTNYTVTFTRGSDAPGINYVYEFEYCDGMRIWVLDCDPSDSRLEIVMSYYWNGEYGASTYIRVSDDGKTVESESAYIWVSEDDIDSFTSEGGFAAFVQTDIFGTHPLIGRVTVGKDGFEVVSDGYTYYYYDDPEYDISVKLKRSLTVIIVDEDGNELGSYTVAKNQKVTPYKTDAESYLILILPDGRLGKVSVEVRSWSDYGDDYGIFINGVDQDLYGDMPYAG